MQAIQKTTTIETMTDLCNFISNVIFNSAERRYFRFYEWHSAEICRAFCADSMWDIYRLSVFAKMSIPVQP